MTTSARTPGATFALNDIGFIDFETRSTADLKRAGTYNYAAAADAIVLAYAIGNAPVRCAVAQRTGAAAPGASAVALGWADLPNALHAHHARVERGEAIWAAWNAAFDRAVWNYSTVDFPFMAPDRIIDVAAQAVTAGLPSDLAGAARQSRVARKLEEGRALIRLFCIGAEPATPASHPDEWARFLAYAAADVEAMRGVFGVTRQLPRAEWEEYWAMEAINERGAHIDAKMAAHAAQLAREDRAHNGAELAALTNGVITTVHQVGRMVTWLLERLPPEGQELITTRAEEVDDDGVISRPARHSLSRNLLTRLLAYCDGRDADAHRLLQIRHYGGANTPAKFARLLDQAVNGDAVLGQYVFNGAGQTGRASSRGVQIHNLARDTLPYEHEAIEALLGGCSYAELKALGGDVPVARTLSLLIRPTFVPACDDNVFVWSDWSQIEARVLPWLAGDEHRLDLFRAVDDDPGIPDLYIRTAAAISRLPIADIDKPLRQRGKVAELALGFGGGVGALQSMAANYGLHLDNAEAAQTVSRWREANPWCVNYWKALWEAARAARAMPGQLQPAGRVAYIYLPSYLDGSMLCRLPSGRLLTYRAIREDLVADLDENDRIIGHTWHLRCARDHGRIKVWPGLLVENIVQAVAADVLRGTLTRLEQMLPVRLHTHDEVLVEVDRTCAVDARAALRAVMRRGFDWSAGLPLMSEETIAPYYTKAESGHYRDTDLTDAA